MSCRAAVLKIIAWGDVGLLSTLPHGGIKEKNEQAT